MEYLWILVNLIFTLGLTLGVGSSTFALTFFIAALRDGQIDASERRLMGIVYFVLRIGMVCIGLGLIGAYLMEVIPTPSYLMQVTLLGVITLNAVLMTMHRMPMRFGPIIAGGSWYALFLVTELPFTYSYPVLLILYAAFVVFFFFLYEGIKARYLPPKPSAPPAPSAS